MTGREMCEFISEVYERELGVHWTPEYIWNLSPTGELWHVWELYERAKQLDSREAP